MKRPRPISVNKVIGASAIIWIFAAILGYPVWWATMNYRGYCINESRYLSRDEIIRSAVHSVLQIYPPVIGFTKVITKDGKELKVGVRERPENHIKYDSIDQFMRLNKDCCQIVEATPDGYERSFGKRISGDHLAIVLIKYDVFYIDYEGDERAVEVSTGRSITNCGRSW